MIDIIYPIDLPQVPLVNGYEEGVGRSQILITDMDTGPSKRRRRSQSAPTPFSLPFVFTAEQKEIFCDWYENALKGGIKTFEWVHPTKRTKAYFQFARPNESLKFSIYNNSGLLYSVTLELNLLP